MNLSVKAIIVALGLLTTNSWAMTCQVNLSSDSSRNGVISINEKTQTLKLNCDRPLPEADSMFADVKDFTTKCSFRLESEGRNVLQYPGFDLREHSHKDLVIEGSLTGMVVPQTKCISSSYGLCHASAAAPELGFIIRLVQDGDRAFNGIFLSTNKTKNLNERVITSVSSSLSGFGKVKVSGTELLIDGDSIRGNKLTSLRGKNTSLTNLFREMNKEIRLGKCSL